jgi:hypothetical protein
MDGRIFLLIHSTPACIVSTNQLGPVEPVKNKKNSEREEGKHFSEIFD